MLPSARATLELSGATSSRLSIVRVPWVTRSDAESPLDVRRIIEIYGRRYEPGAVLCQPATERLASVVIVGLQHLGPRPGTGELRPRVNHSAALAEQAGRMPSLCSMVRWPASEASLALTIRHVTGNLNLLLLRFVSDREIGVPRQEPVPP